jgi:hypothetical protein
MSTRVINKGQAPSQQRAWMLAVLLLALGASAPAVDVLVIPDQYGPGLDALAGALMSSGMNVTVGPTTEDMYDGTLPSPQGFAAVIHLNGSTIDDDMPAEGQQALVSYVQGGGTFIHAEWNAYEYSVGRMQWMRDLTLFDGGNPVFSYMQLQLTPEMGEEQHPILAGLPVPLTFTARCDQVSLHNFPSQPASVLMRDSSGTPAVAVRAFGGGTVIGFHLAAYGGDATTLGDPNVQQLYINCVNWATQHSGLPSIQINGPDLVTCEYGSVFNDPGATASDPEDGNLTPAIAVSGMVDTMTLGSYVLTYIAVDRDGNSASATRTVVVVDTTPPVMRLNGDSSLAWPLGKPFVDPGATAFDAHDGDLTSRIRVKGTVNVAVPGVYTLAYSAVDSSGNSALIARLVTVYAPPIVTCRTDLAQLPWTGGALTDVGLHWNVQSGRGIVTVLCSVTQDEALSDGSKLPHDGVLTLSNGLPDHLSLRDARQAKEDGRVYLITIRAVDDLGQVGSGSCAVVVPKGGSKKQFDDVMAQAAADLAAGTALPFSTLGIPSGNG